MLSNIVTFNNFNWDTLQADGYFIYWLSIIINTFVTEECKHCVMSYELCQARDYFVYLVEIVQITVIIIYILFVSNLIIQKDSLEK